MAVNAENGGRITKGVAGTHRKEWKEVFVLANTYKNTRMYRHENAWNEREKIVVGKSKSWLWSPSPVYSPVSNYHTFIYEGL